MQSESYTSTLYGIQYLYYKYIKRDISEKKIGIAALRADLTHFYSYRQINLEQMLCSNFYRKFNHFSIFRTCLDVSKVLNFYSGQCSRTYMITKSMIQSGRNKKASHKRKHFQCDQSCVRGDQQCDLNLCTPISRKQQSVTKCALARQRKLERAKTAVVKLTYLLQPPFSKKKNFITLPLL